MLCKCEEEEEEGAKKKCYIFGGITEQLASWSVRQLVSRSRTEIQIRIENPIQIQIFSRFGSISALGWTKLLGSSQMNLDSQFVILDSRISNLAFAFGIRIHGKGQSGHSTRCRSAFECVTSVGLIYFSTQTQSKHIELPKLAIPFRG